MYTDRNKPVSTSGAGGCLVVNGSRRTVDDLLTLSETVIDESQKSDIDEVLDYLMLRYGAVIKDVRNLERILIRHGRIRASKLRPPRHDKRR